MADPFVCVRQRAGPLVKALVTDNYGYLRRYGPGAVRGRCGPALSRTTVDKLELRLALLAFKETYNRQWRIGRHGYRSPAQVREKQKAEVARAA